MVPNLLLKEFFQRMGLGHLRITWDDQSEREVNSILHALHTLTSNQFDAIEAALHNVFDLACETGIAAIIEAGLLAGDANLAADLPQDGGAYHKAMWAWLNRTEVVNQAILIHQVEHLPWWRKRKNLPRKEPDLSPPNLQKLEKHLSSLLLREQGRGKFCTVEPLYRHGTDYLFAHPDDFIQNVTSHDSEGRLAPRTFRRTFAIVFAYNRDEGSLELFAKVPPKLKPKLEEVFAKVVLGVELDEWTPDQAYNLNGLKYRTFSLATDPEDCVRARVRKLRLSFKSVHRRMTLEADPDGGPDDIYDMMDEVLNREKVPALSVNVTMATFVFEFLPKDGRKPGSMTFDVAYPSSCSLRNQRPERMELAMKYLKRWKIDVSQSDEPDFAEAG